MNSFTLETEHLIIRQFTPGDLDIIHPIMNEGFGETPLEERREWLDWAVRNYAALARLYQPPYGDYAIALKATDTATDTIIGSVGFVPSYGPFDTLPYFRARSAESSSGLCTPEFGMFWVIDSAHRGKGYALEAAQAMMDYAFNRLTLKRIIATTEYDNLNSQAVMRKLGMTIERNPYPEPHWFQVVGILENPHTAAETLNLETIRPTAQPVGQEISSHV